MAENRPTGVLEPDVQPLPADAPQGEPDPWAEYPISSAVSAEAKPGEWDAYPKSEPEPSRKIAAFGKQASTAAVQTGATMAGAVAGAKLGALGGPYAPITVPAGAAIGGLSGFMFGEGFAELTDTPEIDNTPAKLRPYAIAGEAFGSGSVMGAAPLAAARTGSRLPPSIVGNWINRVIETAGRHPGSFVMGEASASFGAGVAGGAAEAHDPGNLPLRIGAEVAGGFFNPGRLLASAWQGSTAGIRVAIQNMSESGKQTRAGQILQNLIEKTGEDPTALAAALREIDPDGLQLTSAMKTESPALIALERKLATFSGEFDTRTRKTAEQSLAALRNLMVTLRGTGDFNAFAEAAKVRERYFKSLIAARIAAAENKAASAAAQLSEDTPAARAHLGQVAHDVLNNALSDIQKVQDELWGAIPKNLRAQANNVLLRHDLLMSERLPEEKLPEVVQGFITRMSESSETTTGELLRVRNRFLVLMRQAQARPDGLDDARVYGEMAEAILEDLSAVQARAITSSSTTGAAKVKDQIDAARLFTREMHDAFSRTFAGDALAKSRSGRPRIPPELLLQRAIAGGKEAAALRLDELEKATRFLIDKDLAGPDMVENFELMVDAQERLLRIAAIELRDPHTKLISQRKIAGFLHDNEVLLDRFPAVRDDLNEAAKSAEAFENMRKITGQRQRALNEAAFVKMAGTESGADAVRIAFNNSNPRPIATYNQAVRIANRGGEDARAGLRVATWDYVISRATSNTGTLDFASLRRQLMDPIRPGLPSLSTLMKRHGLIDDEGIARMGNILKRAADIQKSLDTGQNIDELIGEPDALFDFVVRVAGAQLGSHSAIASGTGSTLVAAEAGSKLFRKVLEKVPDRQVRGLLIEAAENPQFAAMLIEKAPSPRDKIALGQQLHAYIFAAGYTGAQEIEFPEGTDRPSGRMSRGLSKVTPLAKDLEKSRAAVTPLAKDLEKSRAAVTPLAKDLEKSRAAVTPLAKDLEKSRAAVTPLAKDLEKSRAALARRIEENEGRRPSVYKDHLGNPTIGVGFNLNRPDADEILSSVGADPAAIRSGEQELTKEQIDAIKNRTINEAEELARGLVPDFDNLSDARQNVLIEMAFQMGGQGLSGFKNMLAAINEGDFDRAADEALDSKWAKQDTPGRARELAKILRSG